MKRFSCCILTAIYVFTGFAKPVDHQPIKFYNANNQYIKYVGRVDFSDPLKPRFWSPGVYVQAKFKGTSLTIFINDEEQYGKNHNYLEIAVDNNTPHRIQTTGKTNKIIAAKNLQPGVHTVTICKDTESGIGYIEFTGLQCAKLLPLKLPARKIEYIGDSITCGTGSDQSVIKCEKGEWYDQHNAYGSYGPTVSRTLNTQWQLTAVSGIGLIHSCCDMNITMPAVFDKVNLRANTLQWNFNKYIPDVVTICLGQNDGKQDSVSFCTVYINFIHTVRNYYPQADIICLNSPMASNELNAVLKPYILAIEQYLNSSGDKKVHHFFFSRSFNDGCGGHPSLAQHQLIAGELAGYIKQLKNW